MHLRHVSPSFVLVRSSFSSRRTTPPFSFFILRRRRRLPSCAASPVRVRLCVCLTFPFFFKGCLAAGIGCTGVPRVVLRCCRRACVRGERGWRESRRDARASVRRVSLLFFVFLSAKQPLRVHRGATVHLHLFPMRPVCGSPSPPLFPLGLLTAPLGACGSGSSVCRAAVASVGGACELCRAQTHTHTHPFTLLVSSLVFIFFSLTHADSLIYIYIYRTFVSPSFRERCAGCLPLPFSLVSFALLPVVFFIFHISYFIFPVFCFHTFFPFLFVTAV